MHSALYYLAYLRGELRGRKVQGVLEPRAPVALFAYALAIEQQHFTGPQAADAFVEGLPSWSMAHSNPMRNARRIRAWSLWQQCK